MSFKTGKPLLRSLIQQLKLNNHDQLSLQHSSIYQYIINGFRKNSVTDLQYCRGSGELAFLAQTYDTYLMSRRRLKEIVDEYHGKGERSIEEAAKMVGFKLPQKQEPR